MDILFTMAESENLQEEPTEKPSAGTIREFKKATQAAVADEPTTKTPSGEKRQERVGRIPDGSPLIIRSIQSKLGGTLFVELIGREPIVDTTSGNEQFIATGIAINSRGNHETVQRIRSVYANNPDGLFSFQPTGAIETLDDPVTDDSLQELTGMMTELPDPKEEKQFARRLITAIETLLEKTPEDDSIRGQESYEPLQAGDDIYKKTLSTARRRSHVGRKSGDGQASYGTYATATGEIVIIEHFDNETEKGVVIKRDVLNPDYIANPLEPTTESGRPENPTETEYVILEEGGDSFVMTNQRAEASTIPGIADIPAELRTEILKEIDQQELIALIEGLIADRKFAQEIQKSTEKLFREAQTQGTLRENDGVYWVRYIPQEGEPFILSAERNADNVLSEIGVERFLPSDGLESSKIATRVLYLDPIYPMITGKTKEYTEADLIDNQTYNGQGFSLEEKLGFYSNAALLGNFEVPADERTEVLNLLLGQMAKPHTEKFYHKILRRRPWKKK